MLPSEDRYKRITSALYSTDRQYPSTYPTLRSGRISEVFGVTINQTRVIMEATDGHSRAFKRKANISYNKERVYRQEMEVDKMATTMAT